MTKIKSQSISMDLNYQVVINGELLNNIDYIKCIYCNEKDESKLLKRLIKIELFVKIATILLST